MDLFSLKKHVPKVAISNFDLLYWASVFSITQASLSWIIPPERFAENSWIGRRPLHSDDWRSTFNKSLFLRNSALAFYVLEVSPVS